MSSPTKTNPTLDTSKNSVADITEVIIEKGAEAVAEAYLGKAGGLAASLTVRIISKHGKQLITYWVNRNIPDVDKSINHLSRSQGGSLAPFAVIGLGRCGSRVTAQLARMVAVASLTTQENERRKQAANNVLTRLLSSKSGASVLTVEPVMVVGDIDETTFADVHGLLRDLNQRSSVANRILQIDYQPLAVGGAGNVPLFAEFFTRGLLSLPPQPRPLTDDAKDRKEARADREPSPWEAARTYLIDSCSTDGLNNPRLVFYIFSAGGGTGAGSAAEIMRAQRFAMTTSDQADPQIYFSGVAILPSDFATNRTHLLNTGRTIVQYLADLNLRLESSEEYYDAAHFMASAATQLGGRPEVPMMPWDGLALISNDVMTLEESGTDQSRAEIDANQYIAQQMFNLAASQMSAEQYQNTGENGLAGRLFQSIRLDPQDLRTGLVGPYAICFGAARPEETLTGASLDQLFIRAIGLPQYNQSGKKDAGRIIEGISISPEDPESYLKKTEALTRPATDNQRLAELQPGDFTGLAELELFKRCPRTLFVFTSPQESDIPASLVERLMDLIHWLMPNLSQARYALIRGTTAMFTLSIYIEGSVVLCPDIQAAVKNYLKLCWKQRIERGEVFKKAYDAIIEQEPPIPDKMVEEWLGPHESYRAQIPNFDNIVNGLNTRWLAFVDGSQQTPTDRKADLRKHNVEASYMTAQEAAAALRYINYAKHFEQPEIVP